MGLQQINLMQTQGSTLPAREAHASPGAIGHRVCVPFEFFRWHVLVKSAGQVCVVEIPRALIVSQLLD